MEHRHIIVILGVLVSYLLVCQAANFGESCDEPANCTEANTDCISSLCACTSDSYRNTQTSSCDLKVGLGVECSYDEGCSTANAVCSGPQGTTGSCVCSSGYEEMSSMCKPDLGKTCSDAIDCADTNTICSNSGSGSGSVCSCDTTNHYDSNGASTLGGTCDPKVGLTAACTRDEACSTVNAGCSGNTCQCISGYQAVGTECKPELGTSCSATTDCADNNAVCTGSSPVCSCDTSNYYDSNGESNNGGTCEQKRDLDESCSDVSECADSNTVCNTVCECEPTYYDSNPGQPGGQCNLKRDLDESCSDVSECADSNTVCNTVCECEPTYYDSNPGQPGGQCNLKVGLGITCDYDGACSTDKAECSVSQGSQGTCECLSGYEEKSSTCKPDLGTSCTVSGDCADTNTICSSTGSGSVCSCDTTNYYDSNGATQGGTCAQKVGLTEACPRDEACGTVNAGCSGGSCQCKSGYQAVGAECKPDLGTTCSSSNDCADTFTMCTGQVCVCDTSNYYDSNGASTDGGTCEPKVGLGSVCSYDEACSTANAECSGSQGSQGICQCLSEYEAMSSTCKPDLGTTCSVASDCADTNTICSNSGSGLVCSCDTSSHYDSNGASTPRGTCEPKKDIGELCTGNDECEDIFSTCAVGTCTCQSGYFYTGVVSAEGVCLKRDLGESCTEDSQCLDSNAVCDTVCKCKSTHYDSNTDGQIEGQCILKKDLGDFCTDVVECEDSNTECTSGRCTCKSDYYDTQPAVGGVCQKSDINEGCERQSQCEDANTVCSEGTCQCKAAYYSDGTSCQIKKLLTEACGATNQCADNNAECSLSTCQCIDGFYNTGSGSEGSCALKLSLGASCDKNAACGTPSSTCQGSTCVCLSAYYDDNGENTSGGGCQTRKQLNAQCSSPSSVTEQCVDQNAICTFSNFVYFCRCNSGYVPSTSNTNCVATKALGDACTNIVGECSDPNAQCLDSKCTCGGGHYDDNGLSYGGNCEPVEELKVTNVRFDTVTTNSFTVRWDTPVESAHVNSYQVEWRVKGNSVNSGSLSPSLATASSITGLATGQVYTVTVTSINSVTRQGDTRTTSVSKEQATQPNIPGRLSTSSNYDARSRSIFLSWTGPGDNFSGYRIQVFDGNIVKDTKDVSTNSAEITFSDMKNGYYYHVEITAKSNLFEGSQFVLGEIRKETIRTLVQVPDPPESVACEQTGVHYIQLGWTAPSVPNGIIQSYYVKTFIYLSQFSQTFLSEEKVESSSLKFNVTGLTPGTFYQFRVYAQNEQYNSSRNGQPSSYCGTTAEVSSEPRNLSITAKMSRDITITWADPVTVNSAELLGYVVRFKVAADETCVKEHIYRCSDCVGSFPVIQSCSNSQPEFKTKEMLQQQQTYQALDLKPDIEYDITVSAINSLGQGRMAQLMEKTLEEAPVMPSGVSTSEVMATSLRVTWTMTGDRPGKTNYTVILQATSPAQDKTHIVQGFDSLTTIVTGLQEFWNYTVKVRAATSIGQSTSDMEVPFTTLPAAPGKVSNFNIQTAPGDDYTKLRVTWESPSILEQNSILKEYVFRSNTSENLQRNREATTNSFTETLDVEIERIYFVEVWAVNIDNEVGVKEIRTLQTPAGVPMNTLGSNVAIVMPNVVPQQTALTIKIDQRFLELTNRGTVRGTGVICCAETKCNANSIASLTLDDFNNLSTWHQASKNGYPMYRATPSNWLTEMSGPARRKRALNEREFKIGADSCTGQNVDEFCNGPLTADTAFIISVVVCTNGGCLVSDWYGPYRTEKVPDDDAPIAAIVGGVVGGLVVIAIVAFILFMVMRRRQNKPTKFVGDSEMSIDEKPHNNVQRKRPHRLSDWDNYLTTMHKDANLLFAAEYEDLKSISPAHPQNASNKEENRLKNRYINILPFDHSIVKLSSNGEDDGQDYINANYLPGYKSRREYIGCQGPIPATIDDFWRMVWEQNVSVIVMLTLCKEGQKVKCEQYWPDEVNEPKQYGEIIVEATSKSTIKTYDYRIFNLTVGNKTSTIKQFHFLNWLDFSANVQTGIMIDFLAQVRSHVQPPDTAGPIIVHCSAGVGRTGTYVVLDHLMQFINEHDESEEVDIFNMVMQLRENRPHMVQTEQQYIFIHDCVKEILERKNQQIYQNYGFSNQEEDLYQNEQSLYENVGVKPEQRTNL